MWLSPLSFCQWLGAHVRAENSRQQTAINPTCRVWRVLCSSKIHTEVNSLTRKAGTTLGIESD